MGAGKGGEGEDRARQGLWGRRERLGLVMSGENAGGADGKGEGEGGGGGLE